MKKTIIFSLIIVALSTISIAQTSNYVDSIFDGRKEIYFRFPISESNSLIDFQKGISFDKTQNGYVYAYAHKKSFTDFLTLGINYEKLTAPSLLLSTDKLKMRNVAQLNAKTNNWNFYPTYQAYIDIMQNFADSFPNICKLDTIGYSEEGRLLLSVIISDNVDQDEDEPKFFYSSTMHGDETTGYILMLHYIDYLLNNYNTDSRINSLVNNMKIFINPNANPDGTYAESDNTVNGATRYNSNGTDLNRNYPCPNGNQNPDGEARAAETQAFMDYGAKNDFVMIANFHGGAEITNYPWDYKTDNHADKTWWINIGKEYADTANYYGETGYFDDYYTSMSGNSDYNGVTEGANWYITEGGRQDYTTYFHHSREITIEISETKLPAADLLESFWDANYRSLLNFMEQCLFGIRGIVVDSCTNQAIKAKITIDNHDLDSSEIYSSLPIGNYHRPIEDGTWTMIVSADGYQSKTIENISTSDKNTTIQNFALIPIEPTANFTTNTNNSCTGNIKFTNTGIYAQSSSILWDFGDGTTSTDENPNHFYNDNGTYSVKLTISNCGGSNSITKENFITIAKDEAPIINNAEICKNTSTTISSSNENTYWLNETDSLLFLGQNFTTPILDTTTTYKFYTKNISETSGGKIDNSGDGAYFSGNYEHGLIFNCTKPTLLKSVKVYSNATENHTISLQNSEGVTLQEVSVSIPNGESDVILNMNIPAGNDLRLMAQTRPKLYRNGSDTGENLLPLSVGENITITKSTATGNEYQYYYFFYNWKISDTCLSETEQFTVAVSEPTEANFSFTTDSLNCTFINESVEANSYYWDFGDGQSSTETNPYHSYATIGNYEVTLIAESNCSDTIQKNVNIVIDGIKEYENLFSIYPNPAKQNRINLTFSSQNEAFYFYKINSNDGRTIITDKIKAIIGKNNISIDISKLANGFYTLEINDNENQQTLKFIKN